LDAIMGGAGGLGGQRGQDKKKKSGWW
jgi:hypothetical protein